METDGQQAERFAKGKKPESARCSPRPPSIARREEHGRFWLPFAQQLNPGRRIESYKEEP
jgi:hypothetical protein